mgnify:CR=1 FL=1
MIEKFISLGDKLELKSTVRVILPDGTEGVKTYKSTVHNILDDGRLELKLEISIHNCLKFIVHSFALCCTGYFICNYHNL